MEVQLALPVPVPVPVPGDFNFDSNCSSPYITAPSSPQRFGNLFFSAPTSPTRISPLLSQSSVPLHLEQTPQHNNNDFEFDFSGNLETISLSAADELFHAGKIRPLKPPSPPRLQPNDRAIISPRTRNLPENEEKRGRERVICSGCRKGSRSLSPLRVSDIAFESSSEDNKDLSSSSSNSKSFLSFTKKWRLRNLLLFRSASEGRANENDPLRKYTALSKKEDDVRNCSFREDDVRNCSFRSSDSGSVSKRRGPVSAHELHYTLNRAASEEMKKKTFLPYKQGLLGCLGFNRDMRQISKGIGSLPRS